MALAIVSLLTGCQTSPGPRTVERRGVPPEPPVASSSPAPSTGGSPGVSAASAEPPDAAPLTKNPHSGKPHFGKHAAQPDSEAQAEPEAPREERTGAPGTTRGTIACGHTRCRAGQDACISDPGWHCIPAGEDAETEERYACDDGSDCPSGQACCLSFASALSFYGCVSERAECRQEVCVVGDGTPCPKGQQCDQGECRPPARPATCGSSRCPAARPWCLWSGEKATCVAADQLPEPGEPSTRLLRCSRPGDCGAGMACCTDAIWQQTHCATNCDMSNEGQICRANADCAPHLDGTRAKCTAVQSDEPSEAALPSWLKVCHFD
jgi:hypothetical protein